MLCFPTPRCVSSLHDKHAESRGSAEHVIPSPGLDYAVSSMYIDSSRTCCLSVAALSSLPAGPGTPYARAARLLPSFAWDVAHRTSSHPNTVTKAPPPYMSLVRGAERRCAEKTLRCRSSSSEDPSRGGLDSPVLETVWSRSEEGLGACACVAGCVRTKRAKRANNYLRGLAEKSVWAVTWR